MTLNDIIELSDVDNIVIIDLAGETYEIESVEQSEGRTYLNIIPGGEG